MWGGKDPGAGCHTLFQVAGVGRRVRAEEEAWVAIPDHSADGFPVVRKLGDWLAEVMVLSRNVVNSQLEVVNGDGGSHRGAKRFDLRDL